MYFTRRIALIIIVDLFLSPFFYHFSSTILIKHNEQNCFNFAQKHKHKHKLFLPEMIMLQHHNNNNTVAIIKFEIIFQVAKWFFMLQHKSMRLLRFVVVNGLFYKHFINTYIRSINQ